MKAGSKRIAEMKKLLLLSTILILTSCAEFDAAKSGIATHGAKIADDALEIAIWQQCEAGSVGSIKRKFQTPEQVAAYNVLCPAGKLPVLPQGKLP